MARGKRHDNATKAAVVAALLAGQGVDQIADDYDLPVATIRTWQHQLRSADELVQPEKKDELGEMILAYVRQNLSTLAAQSLQFSDQSWLQKQPAADLAVLHGVIADKTIRILAALEPPQE